MTPRTTSFRPVDTLDLVVPCFNEEDGIEHFHKMAATHLDSLCISVRFIFVDDGSTDNTLARLNALADRDPRVCILSLSRNFGHQMALTAGLDHTKADVVVVMDADLQHPPNLIAEMIDHYKGGADVVYAVRKRASPLGSLRGLFSKTYYSLLSRLTRIVIIPGAADFRLMSKRVVTALRGMRETNRYLRGMVSWVGFPYAVVTYSQKERFAGRPSYDLNQSLNLARHGLFSFSTVPLAVITRLGFLLSFLAFLYFCYILVAALSNRTIPGWPSVIAVILIASGIQLVSLGVIAQYVGLIFEEVKHRPLYVVKNFRFPDGTTGEAGEENGPQTGSR